MTQPAAEQPRRISLDELTSDALDQLYADLQWTRDKLLEAQAETTAERTRAETTESRLAALKRAHVALVEQAGKDQAAIARVRAVHQPARDWSWKPFGCNHFGEHKAPCASCGTCWPCPTITALDEQQEQP